MCVVYFLGYFSSIFLRITLQKRRYKILSCTSGCASSRVFHPYLCIFKSVVALSVSQKIVFLCIRTGRLIQLYSRVLEARTIYSCIPCEYCKDTCHTDTSVSIEFYKNTRLFMVFYSDLGICEVLLNS